MAIGHISFQVPKRVIPKAFLRPFRCGEVLVGVGVVLEVWCKSYLGGSFQYVEAAFSFSVFGSWGKIFGEGKKPFFSEESCLNS